MRNDSNISCMKSQSGFPSSFILHVSACDSMLLRDVLHAGSQKVLVILLNAAAVSSSCIQQAEIRNHSVPMHVSHDVSVPQEGGGMYLV